MGRDFDEDGTGWASDGERESLREASKAGLADRVAAIDHPRDRRSAVVVLKTHRAFWRLHWTCSTCLQVNPPNYVTAVN